MTKDQIQAHLDVWYAADAALASGQEYTMQTGGGSRTLKRVDAAEVRSMISYWEQKLNNIQGIKNNPVSYAKFE